MKSFLYLILSALLVTVFSLSCISGSGSGDDDDDDSDDRQPVDDDDNGSDDDDDTFVPPDDDDDDSRIPEAPDELRAMGVSDEMISLTWTDNSDNDDGFIVYRKGPQDADFSEHALTGADVSFYFDDALDCQTGYDYFVTAFNSAGESDPSNEANGQTEYCLVAAPSGLSAIPVGQTQVDLFWSDNSFNEDGFEIQRREIGADAWIFIGDVDANFTAFSDIDAICRTEFEYRIKAYNVLSESAWSDAASATTDDCPAIRPRPVLSDTVPLSYVALSRDFLEDPPDPMYPLTVTGEGLASDTAVMIGDFLVPCDTGGEGIGCKADEAGVPVEGTCATSCIAALPDEIMRHAAEYVVRLLTADPVFGGNGISESTEFFNVVAPQPEITNLWPRGVMQLLDENSHPVPQDVLVKVQGRNMMENVQIRLDINYGQVDELVTDPETGDQELTALISTSSLEPREQPYLFSVSNPNPGGGERARPFGVNPRIGFWSNRQSVNLIPTSAAGYHPSVRQRIGAPQSVFDAGMAWGGNNSHAMIRDEEGNLMARVSRESSPGVVPLSISARWVDMEDFLGNGSMGSVSVVSPMLKRGDGTFKSPSTLTMGADMIKQIGALDITGDGISDIVAVDSVGDIFSIRAGNSSGGYETEITWPMGASPYAFQVADLNCDSILDVVTVNMDDNNVTIRFGNGDGSFGVINALSMGFRPTDLAVADIDMDGFLDLITGDYGNATYSEGTVSTRFGNGDGTFSTRSELVIDAGQVSGVKVADFNGDGIPDLVIQGYLVTYEGLKFYIVYTGFTTVMLGLGNGEFVEMPIARFIQEDKHTGAAVADFDGDGTMDLAVSITGDKAGIPGRIDVYYGAGDGEFFETEHIPLTYQEHPQAISAGDVNGDSVPDIAIVYQPDYDANERIGIFINDGTGAFDDPPIILTSGFSMSSLVLADVNADGGTDILAGGGAAYIYSSNDPTGLSALDQISMGDGTFGLKVADINGDDMMDLITSLKLENKIAVRFGNGDGTFGNKTTYTTAAGPQKILLDYVNNDDYPDIVSMCVGTHEVSVNLGNASGGFSAPISAAMGSYMNDIALGYFNADDYLDLVATDGSNSPYPGGIYYCMGDGTGAFGASSFMAFGTNPNSVATVDLNGDDKTDVIAANGSQGKVTYRYGNGDGTFGATGSITMANSSFIKIEDINDDAIPDLVTYDTAMSVRYGDGESGFGDPYSFSLAAYTNYMEFTDLNGDRYTDIIAVHSSQDSISVRLNNGDGTFGPASVMAMGDNPKFVAAIDLDDNGMVDMLSSNYNDDDVSLRLLGVSVNFWHQELTDSFSPDPNQPWLPRNLPAGQVSGLEIHQGIQEVTSVGLWVVLEWTRQPSGDIGFVLTAPDGSSTADLGSYNTFTPWPPQQPTDDNVPESWRFSKVFRGSEFTELGNLIGEQPTGVWNLDVDNQTGQEANILQTTIITDGYF